MRLRTWLMIAGGFLALVCLGAATALEVLTSRLAHSTAEVSEAVESVRAAEELEIALLKHSQAVGAVAEPGAKRSPEARAAVSSTLQDINTSLNQIERHVTSPRERALADDVEAKTAAHVAEIEQMVPAPTSSNIVATMSRAVDATQRLAEFNVAEARSASLHADDLRGVASLVAGAAAGALVVGLLFAIYIVQSKLYRPLVNVREALISFRGGNAEARAPVKGPVELREIGSEFNEMVRALNHTREAQLQFVAGVAHDLKNPLAALQLTTAGIMRSTEPTDPERLRKAHGRILHQVSRLNRMVGDLLDTSRIYGGHLDLQWTACDLRQIAFDTADLYRATSELHSIEIEVPEEPVSIRCDTTRIEQVLNNLVSNAIKYSPHGGRVMMQVGTKDGFATASVTDQGIGISPEDQERIFEPFRRSRSVSENIPGVGLGLSVARTIVEAHGGHIDVESAPGHGSTFRVYVPLSPTVELGEEQGATGAELTH